MRSISNETTLGRIPTHPAVAIVTATTSNRSTTSARRGYPSGRRLLRGGCGGSDRRSDELVQSLHVIGKVLPTATLLHRGRKETLIVGFKTLVVANATAISKPFFARVRVDVWPIPTYGIRWSSQRITTIRGRNYATFSHARRREAGVALTPLTATECASRRIVFVTLVIRIINLITTTRYFHIGAKRISSGHGQASLGRHTKRTKRRPGCSRAANTAKASTASLKDFPGTSTNILKGSTSASSHAGNSAKKSFRSDFIFNFSLSGLAHCGLFSSLLSSLSGTFFSSGSGCFCASRLHNFTCPSSGCSTRACQSRAKSRTAVRAETCHQALTKITGTCCFNTAHKEPGGKRVDQATSQRGKNRTDNGRQEFLEEIGFIQPGVRVNA